MNQIAMLREKKINLKGIIKPPDKKDILKTVVLMICQRAAVLGGFPFGCVFFGAVCTNEITYLTIPAIIIGALWGGAPVMKYTAAALIIWIYKLIVPQKKRTVIISAATCAGAVFLCGLYGAVSSANVTYNLLLLASLRL